ncbi:hypothetical protein IV102_38205 [bacterium]|nr:hypothetical protein [bacterium]
MDLSERKAIGEHFQRHPWERARAQFVVHELNKLRPIAGPILDVGCGDAYVLSQVKMAFPESPCLGVDTAFCGQTPCPPGMQIYSSLEAVPASFRPASVILLMDVLEHLADPTQLLCDLRKQGLASRHTRVLVTVPAYQILFGKHDHWLGHFRRYDRRLLLEHLQAGGIEVQDSSYFFLSLLFIRGLEVILQRLQIHQPQSTGLVEWKGSALQSRWLSLCLQVDFRICQWVRAKLGLTLPGLSCCALGQFQ